MISSLFFYGNSVLLTQIGRTIKWCIASEIKNAHPSIIINSMFCMMSSGQNDAYVSGINPIDNKRSPVYPWWIRILYLEEFFLNFSCFDPQRTLPRIVAHSKMSVNTIIFVIIFSLQWYCTLKVHFMQLLVLHFKLKRYNDDT